MVKLILNETKWTGFQGYNRDVHVNDFTFIKPWLYMRLTLVLFRKMMRLCRLDALDENWTNNHP